MYSKSLFNVASFNVVLLLHRRSLSPCVLFNTATVFNTTPFLIHKYIRLWLYLYVCMCKIRELSASLSNKIPDLREEDIDKVICSY